MIFKKGSYAFEEFKTLLTDFSIEPEYVERDDEPVSFLHKLSVRGTINGTSQTDLTAKLAALETAFKLPGEDVGLYQEGGVIASHHFLAQTTSLSGVRLTNLTFPEAAGTEYFNHRTVVAEFESRYANGSGTVDNIISWEESFSYVGTGGPHLEVLRPISGPPIIQQTNAQTEMRGTQTGRAVGRNSPPGPVIFPTLASIEDTEKRRITTFSPRNLGGAFTGFGIAWTFEYLSPGFSIAMVNIFPPSV